jgi:thymidine phosphorylase
MDVWRRMISAQGGDPDAPLATARHIETVAAPGDGVLQTLDARAVGIAAWRLGAGRSRKEDPVSEAAGIVLRAKPGDHVTAGSAVLELHTDDEIRIAGAMEALAGAWTIGPEPPTHQPLIIDRIRP